MSVDQRMKNSRSGSLRLLEDAASVAYLKMISDCFATKPASSTATSTTEENEMSRSNPTEGARNPSTRWFEWAGGSDGGYVRWYNKDTKENVKAEPFAFLLLDELSTVKGWHEPSESAIYANEVKDTRQDVLVVRSFKGGDIANGIYQDIKDRVAVKGGHYVASLYIAYKDGEALKIGNLGLKGAAAGAWMDFKRNAPTKKDAAGKTLKSYFVDAVKIAGYEDAKKGGTAYRVPVFKLAEVSPSTNEQAIALDAELQAFLAEYLKRPKAEAAKPENAEESEEPQRGKAHVDDLDDDIPF